MSPTKNNTNRQSVQRANEAVFRTQDINEAQAWSDLSQPAATTLHKQRYKAQAKILDRAVSGDIHAAADVMHYLSSNNADLRMMMQSALHDYPDAKIWRYLLNFLALYTWEDAYWHIGLVEPPAERAEMELRCAEINKQMGAQAKESCLQSVIEVFALDESENERKQKNDLLSTTLSHSGEISPRLPPSQAQRRRLVRYAAVYLSGLRADPQVIPILEEMIEDAELSWKTRAVHALGVINDTRCGPALLKALASGQHPLHQDASRVLNEMGPLALGIWEEALQHPNSHVRWHAARGLGQVGDTRGIEILAEGLDDENQAVRWVTARVLANLDSTAIPAILNVLTQHRLSEPLRQAANHALHAMPSRLTQEYLQPLLKALHSPAASVEVPHQAQLLALQWKRIQSNQSHRKEE